MLPYHFEQLVATVLVALSNTWEKCDTEWHFRAAPARETRRKHSQAIIRLFALRGRKFKRLVTFEKSEEFDVSLRKGFFLSPVDLLVCVPSVDWQLGTRVCVGVDRIHLLSAWLYMVCFVSTTTGQHWHIEVFISRKQVVEERGQAWMRASLFPCLPLCVSALH